LFPNHIVPNLLTAAGAALLLASPAMAAAPEGSAGTRNGATIDGVGQELTVDCEGRPAAVTGSDNRIQFVGDCPVLTVTGTDNQVRIVLRAGAPVQVSGVDNIVTWTVNGDGRPRASISGVGNKVAPAR